MEERVKLLERRIEALEQQMVEARQPPLLLAQVGNSHKFSIDGKNVDVMWPVKEVEIK